MMINVKVKPNSPKQKIEKFGDNKYLVYLKEKSENNKANIELINLLSKYFRVPYNYIKIKNPTSKPQNSKNFGSRKSIKDFQGNKIIELELK